MKYTKTTTEEDYSNYKPETSRNGGDYGFWEYKHEIIHKGEKYVWYTEHTTSEFPYCEASGRFCQSTKVLDVVLSTPDGLVNTGKSIAVETDWPYGDEHVITPKKERVENMGETALKPDQRSRIKRRTRRR